MARISRRDYADAYGPTTGDMVRLGDTTLLAEIEHDYTVYGEELTTGAGKAMRDGEGLQTTGSAASGALDSVIHNATIIDAVLGIVPIRSNGFLAATARETRTHRPGDGDRRRQDRLLQIGAERHVDVGPGHEGRSRLERS